MSFAIGTLELTALVLSVIVTLAARCFVKSPSHWCLAVSGCILVASVLTPPDLLSMVLQLTGVEIVMDRGYVG